MSCKFSGLVGEQSKGDLASCTFSALVCEESKDYLVFQYIFCPAGEHVVLIFSNRTSRRALFSKTSGCSEHPVDGREFARSHKMRHEFTEHFPMHKSFAVKGRS